MSQTVDRQGVTVSVVLSPCGKYKWSDGKKQWIEATDDSGWGQWLHDNAALAALNHPDTPPPPGWNEPEGKCQECGVVGGHQSLCNQKPEAKPASPGLRAAGEPSKDVRGGCAQPFDFSTDCDAARCPHGAKVTLFRIAECLGKNAYWNARCYLSELTEMIDTLQHKELNP